MYVAILGSAAGGGFPQWNCNCGNCRSVRERKFLGKACTQTQVAVRDDGHAWFLLNASPDLRMQIERSAALQPNSTPSLGRILREANSIFGMLNRAPQQVCWMDMVRRTGVRSSADIGRGFRTTM